MANRPKHPRKDGEACLRALEQAGWRVKKGKKYFTALCPCGKMQPSIYLTPRSNGYFAMVLKRMRHGDCWPKVKSNGSLSM